MCMDSARVLGQIKFSVEDSKFIEFLGVGAVRAQEDGVRENLRGVTQYQLFLLHFEPAHLGEGKLVLPENRTH